MPSVTAIERSGQQVTVRFDDGPPLQCDRAFPLARTLDIGQTLEPAILDRLRDQALRHMAEAVAVRWLAPRARSRADVARRLQRQSIPEPIIVETLAHLEAKHYLDDAAFAQLLTKSRSRRRPRSRQMIGAELRAEGVADAVASDAADNVDDVANARAFAATRATSFQGDWDTFHRRTGAALLRRGFSREVAESALHAAWDARHPTSSS